MIFFIFGFVFGFLTAVATHIYLQKTNGRLPFVSLYPHCGRAMRVYSALFPFECPVGSNSTSSEMLGFHRLSFSK